MFRRLRIITLVLIALAVFSATVAYAQSGNVEIRAEGLGVSIPDVINGYQAMTVSGLPVDFIISAESDFELQIGVLGFRLFSPDASIAVITHIKVDSFPVWDEAFNIPAAIYAYLSWNGILPDTIGLGGASFSDPEAFGPTDLVDIIRVSLAFPDSPFGIFLH